MADLSPTGQALAPAPSFQAAALAILPLAPTATHVWEL